MNGNRLDMHAELYFRNSDEGVIGCPVKDGPWIHFSNPLEIYSTNQPAEVPQVLGHIRDAVLRGFWAAGYISYEAAAGLDPAFKVHTPGDDMPLIWFALFEKPEWMMDIALDQKGDQEQERSAFDAWRPLVSRSEYLEDVSRIREYIRSGDTYQVNYCYPMCADLQGNPLSGFLELYGAQPTDYAAYVDTGRQQILSHSPELFFCQNQQAVITRPMKGTAPRGRWQEEDEENIRHLALNPKDRAENLMIVDLLRNDLGRIALTGSVEVTSMHEIEKYRTVLQMTSTIRAKTDGHPVETMKALFPSGSVTGVPKIRTMEIIQEQEPAPRGAYTGAIGWFGPGCQARFNVAIRTITIQPLSRGSGSRKALFGVGGGITWYSDAADEFNETCTKSRVLFQGPPDFKLLEAVLWEPGRGYFLLDLHLKRLAASAAYFDFRFEPGKLQKQLEEEEKGFSCESIKLRVTLDREGCIQLDCMRLSGREGTEFPEDENLSPLHVSLAAVPVDNRDPFLFHKTTNRSICQDSLDACHGMDDVILWNEKGEVTESSRANIVVDTGQGLVTPERTCGLLAGTFRDHLLREGGVQEGVIDKKMLALARRFWLINSVRRWMRAELVVGADAWGDRHQSVSLELCQGKHSPRLHTV
jgi:para-aminobenzoate synthetase/4-amino-4-deoxychorismate lyase